MTMLTNLEINPSCQPIFLYGTTSCGADILNAVLGKGRLIFSVNSRLRSENPVHRTKYFRTEWSKYPKMDLLAVAEDRITPSTTAG